MRNPTSRLEMWGGIEATVNRVGDRYFDQMERNGHARRLDDLERIAALGITALRYPVLWERIAPDHHLDWSWPDQRIPRLLELGINPIVGLTHHGSGPRHTSLVDPAFPEKLAGYARAVATRYPDVTDYTPVNEPLTTARFSGLYGHWYPHGHDSRTFVRALVNQCRGVIEAMAAIREVTPGARLVQTEDLGRIYSTPPLADLAAFQNQRRWLSIDLLCGQIDRAHPLWSYLHDAGASEEELLWFVEHPCAPDILGINHYLTSDRFLDHDLSDYPDSRAMVVDGRPHADVEAVRADLEVPVGTCSALREAWERYRLPVAVTEAHYGGTREEQLRWLFDVWDGSSRLRRAGADVRAVTAWSVFGAFDWNMLVTREADFYEPGLFDVRAPTPRPTALARLVHALATTGSPESEPLLNLPGWWRRRDRLFRGPAQGRVFEPAPSLPVSDMSDRAFRPLLVLGPTGTLGQAFIRVCDARGIPYHMIGRRELDLAGSVSIDSLLLETNAWGVVNAAGYVEVDRAETEPTICHQVNAISAIRIAEACARYGVPLMTFSSDLVFGGDDTTAPYLESHPTAPLNVYGQSKAAMEAGVREAFPDTLIIRTSSFFGPWDAANFVTNTLAKLTAGEHVKVANDQIVSPTYVPDLVHAALDLFVDREVGIWHLANRGELTWNELGCRVAEMAAAPVQLVEPCASGELGLVAKRPSYSALGSERGWLLPSLDEALARFFDERAQRRT